MLSCCSCIHCTSVCSAAAPVFIAPVYAQPLLLYSLHLRMLSSCSYIDCTSVCSAAAPASSLSSDFSLAVVRVGRKATKMLATVMRRKQTSQTPGTRSLKLQRQLEKVEPWLGFCTLRPLTATISSRAARPWALQRNFHLKM